MMITYASNPRGSLHEECKLSPLLGSATGETILPDGDLAEVVKRDAQHRLFQPEQIEAMVEHYEDFDALCDLMSGLDDALPNGATDGGAGDNFTGTAQTDAGGCTDDDMVRLADDIAQSHGAPAFVPVPDVRLEDQGAVWYEYEQSSWVAPGASGVARLKQRWVLKAKQRVAYERLKHSGHKQLLSFLSGEGGMGKSMLIRLLTQWWRSQGLRVIVLASSGKAARLISGHTVHSACKLHPAGRFLTTKLEVHSPHFAWLFGADVIVIDEISMLTATALAGVNSALNFVASRGASTQSARAFGGKSLATVGDLYQLPAVEKLFNLDQVYQSVLWPEFSLLELDECCRVRPDERAFMALQSRARVSWRCDAAECAETRCEACCALYTADEALLRTRLCSEHCRTECGCEAERYVDKQQVRSLDADGRRDEQEVPHTVAHCPLDEHATVLVAKRAKVDALCEKWARSVQQSAGATVTRPAANAAAAAAGLSELVSGVVIHTARDRGRDGGVLTDGAVLDTVDKRTRGKVRKLALYKGMRAVLTDNKSVKDDFVNGTVGIVEDIYLQAGAVKVIYFRPESYAPSAPALRVVPKEETVNGIARVGSVRRLQFPLLPAHCVTVHRVQGSTLTHDVHVLLNREFFAPGQAYVALTRVTTLRQLHFWCLNMDAFVAHPDVELQYRLLRLRPLTQAVIDTAAKQLRPHLPPMSRVLALQTSRGRRQVQGMPATSGAAGPSALHAAQHPG